MKGLSVALSLAAAVSSVTAATLDPLVIKGSKFFYKTNGTEFFIKGVAYQADLTNATSDQQFTDPLADSAGCTRDIPLIQALGMNTIRVYALDTKQDHSACMTMLQNAGIYVVADLSEPGTSINRDEPLWDVTLLNRYTSVIDMMQQYTNVLGFFAGNEVTNNNTNTDASAYVRAAIRDTKAYIKSKNYRSIPVGYATNDASDIRNDLADYFNCGDQSSAIDFWGYNIYSWCDPSSYTTSGWDVRTQEYSNYSVPVFFAEYGCNNIRPRTWGEVAALYGPQMTPVFSGGIVYMYFEETNKYGLVNVQNKVATKLQDYINLQTAMASISPSGVQASAYTPTNSARACPATGADWSASTTLPPTPDNDLCNCMVSSLSCVVADSVTDDAYGALFGTACGGLGTNGCNGINGNGTTGSYGAYSNCEAKQKLSWALNAVSTSHILKYIQQFY